MKRILLMLACISTMVCMTSANATASSWWWKKKAKTEKTDSVKKETDYDKFLKKKPETHKGFITLYKQKGKVYMEIPKAIMGRDMLLGSTVSEISDNGDAIIGSKPLDPLHITFSNVGKKVNLILINKDYITDSKNEMLIKALDKNSAGSILYSFKVEAFNNDSTAVLFDATDFFVSNQKLMSPFDPYGENTFMGQINRSEQYESSKSYLGDIKSFENNLSIKSYLSYKYSLSYKGQQLRENVPFTALMTRSILLLDEKPYTPRPVDSRIGIFPTAKILFSGKKQKSETVYFANRWRIEPVDTAAYQRGELVEVKKPIIFYIDPAFPEEWKPAIYEAVNQWQEPFEKIGFKNAIMAKPFPENDPEFDPDNIKYNCIRYAPIGIMNAMGPSWVDPRSGEIINASVYVYHDVVQVINNWRYIQTAQTDESVRSGTMPKEVFDDALRYVLTHEVGHCLGLMHNMSASATVPVDSLRSPSYTQKYGTTHSIMDYARFNYVAQPGDAQKGVKLTPPRFGIYDYYAIKFSYTPIFNSKGYEEDYKITSKWLHDAQADPILRYGKQQFGQVFDPHSLMEDLGDDAMKASTYGIKNLKLILSNLNDWVKNDPDYSYRKSIYTGIVYQYLNYIQHVYTNIGGIYLQEKMDGDPVDGLRCVPKETEKRAVDFLCAQLKDLDWLNNSELNKNIQIMGNPSKTLQTVLVQAIMAIPMKISATSTLGKDVYTVPESLEDLYKLAWTPTIKGKKLTDLEMMLQREFMSMIFGNAGIPYTGIGAAPKSLTNPTVISTPEFLQSYAKINQHLCYSANCNHNISGSPVAGYDQPYLYFVTVPLSEALAYTYINKVKSLLNSKKYSATGETKAHYELILRNIEKSLK